MFTIHFDKPFKNDDHFGINIMHHVALHSFKVRVSQSFFFRIKGQPISKSVMASSSEANSHVQHSNDRKEFLEQENRVLHEEIAAMRTKMEEMTERMRTMVAAPAQAPPSPPARTQAEAPSSAILEWTMCVDTPTHSAPQRSMP